MQKAFNKEQLLEQINRLREVKSVGFQANEIPKTHLCNKCRDEEGFIVRNAEGNEVWVECECAEKKRIQRLFKVSMVTEEFQKKTFDNYILQNRPDIVHHAFKAAKHYFETFHEIRHTRQNSIALLGRPGCGKTHLLMAISNSLMKTGIPVLYFPWVEGFNEIKDNLDLLDTKIHRLQMVDVLYIDDMFKGRKAPTDFQIEQLFAIINYRYLNNKPILISSEKDIDEMCEFDEGIGSRINDICKDFRVILKGDKSLNYRLED